MSIHSILHATFSGDADLAALVGNRIYVGIAKQGTPRPYVSYQVVSDVPFATQLDATRICNSTATVQIDCWANSVAQAAAIAEAVKEAIYNAEESGRVDIADINATRWLNDDAGTEQLYRASIEAEIYYS